jgi:hypothetical protein
MTIINPEKIETALTSAGQSFLGAGKIIFLRKAGKKH